MSLLVEDLRNRLVVKVAVGYVLASFALLLPLGLASTSLGLPDWTVRMLAGIAFLALPFVLVLTWALDDGGPTDPRLTRRR